ncbi:hypothetical protein XU18_1494 [Perkinsela sp. CCAP 1560/4]|nr:hypothetical protein XU18_1494 [Perkinsela sp. CCAP 1560/4]|eukprot:KNH07908.1 hypothetical protein XU18_1494 [Perkinsela sp. CCAP 1560/4]
MRVHALEPRSNTTSLFCIPVDACNDAFLGTYAFEMHASKALLSDETICQSCMKISHPCEMIDWRSKHRSMEVLWNSAYSSKNSSFCSVARGLMERMICLSPV